MFFEGISQWTGFTFLFRPLSTAMYLQYAGSLKGLIPIPKGHWVTGRVNPGQVSSLSLRNTDGREINVFKCECGMKGERNKGRKEGMKEVHSVYEILECKGAMLLSLNAIKQLSSQTL